MSADGKLKVLRFDSIKATLFFEPIPMKKWNYEISLCDWKVIGTLMPD